MGQNHFPKAAALLLRHRVRDFQMSTLNGLRHLVPSLMLAIGPALRPLSWLPVVGPMYRFGKDRVAEPILEFFMGLETSRDVYHDRLGFGAERGHHYMASRWSTLVFMLKEDEVSPDDIFIDFGSGKGRVVYHAACLPLKRVIGVEMSEKLNQVARRNIERTRHRLKCQDVKLITADILDYEIPDDLTIAFFFNTIDGPAFCTVIDRIVASLRRNPRQLTVIYNNPRMHDYLVQSGFSAVRQFGSGVEGCTRYTWVPPSAPAT